MATPLETLRAYIDAHPDQWITEVRGLDCGHAATVVPESIGTGIAHSADGRTLCYECANRAEVAAFAKARAFTGYVTEAHPGTFTTWTGHELAKVTRTWLSKARYTPTGGQYRMRYVHATAPDGSTWRGQGSDNWEVFTLHRTSP